MSKLKDLVPPLDMCRKIPVGKFEDSALVLIFWHKSPNTPVEIRTRCEVENDPEFDDLVEDQRIIIYPAPTLAEIMGKIDYYIPIQRDSGNLYYLSHPKYDDDEFADRNPATAALRLWLTINKTQPKER